MPSPLPEVSQREDLEELERFVTENDDLLELENRIGRFNVFEALQVADAEIKHSRFLAWLLDPSGSHGQGDLFLRSVMMDILRCSRKTDLSPSVSAVDLYAADLASTTIELEWNRLDILIHSPNPPLVIAIENKVWSKEHSSQLARYEVIVDSKFNGIPVIRVFLTREGALPKSSKRWLVYRYSDLHRVLTRVVGAAGGSIESDVAVFIRHYLSLIESRLMDDKKIDDLCRKIIATHGRALRIIQERMPTGAGGPFIEMCEQALAADAGKWLVCYRNIRCLQFVPRVWVGSIRQEDGEVPAKIASAMCFEIEVWGNEEFNLSIRLVVGPGPDPSRRNRVIERLKQPPLDFKMQRKVVTGKWTRLESTTLFTWTSGAEPDAAEVSTELLAWLNSRASKFRAIMDAVLAE